MVVRATGVVDGRIAARLLDPAFIDRFVANDPWGRLPRVLLPGRLAIDSTWFGTFGAQGAMTLAGRYSALDRVVR